MRYLCHPNDPSFTPGSLRLNRKKTSKDKFLSYKNTILNSKWCPMSEVESIFNAKGYRSYFNCQVRDWSRQLWFPTEIDCVDLLSTSCNTFSPSMERNSWFSIKTLPIPQTVVSTNLPKISWQSTPSISVACKESEQPKTDETVETKVTTTDPTMVTHKIRMYYNKKQRTLLKQWIGSCRLIYNMVTQHFKTTNKLQTLKFYRNMLSEKAKQCPFLDGVPYNSKDESIKEAMSNIKTVLTLRKKNAEHHQGTPFRCKHKDTQTLPVRVPNINKDLKIYPNLLFNKTMFKDGTKHMQRMRKNTKFDKDGDFRDSHLCHVKSLREWYLCLVERIEKDVSRENQTTEKMISIDPGNRTFATWFSPTEGIGKVGEGDGKKLIKLCLMMDNLYSQCRKTTHKSRQRMSRCIARLRKRLQNIRKEFHNKFASFLTTKYDVIIIPKFNTHLMSKKGSRKIGKKTVRGLMTWGHGMFREKLREMCERKGKRLHSPSEAYTSKTCSNCGWIKENLGGREVFKCENCKKSIDRDVNGARGIMLRAMLDGAIRISK